MNPYLGYAIVLTVLGLVVFFAIRYLWRERKNGGCGGGCSSCGSSKSSGTDSCGCNVSAGEVMREVRKNKTQKPT